MIGVAMLLAWLGYTTGYWGYSLVKGYNLGLREIVSPVNYYTGQWPPQEAGNAVVIPDGTSESLVTVSFDTGSTSTSTSTGTGGPVTSIATKYVGHCYLYGGAPGLSGKNCWDCSSFVNWVVGHEAGKAIPGFGPGKYTGAVHGPPTGSWIGFGTGVPRDQMQPGDIIVWPTHMGIYLGSGNMISALNEKLGTRITTVIGGTPMGEAYIVRRV